MISNERIVSHVTKIAITKKKRKQPTIFLSIDPSSKKRIENLNNWISEVMIKYPPIKT